MTLALKEASKALEKDEVPIGAVIVKDGEVIAKAHNLTQTNNSPLAHSEILCIAKASKKLSNFRLVNCDIYITMEPCLMCFGAIVEARIRHIYFGCYQEKMGAFSKHHLSSTIPYTSGIMAAESIALLQTFFKSKR